MGPMPPPDVLAAFGARRPPVRLPGGQGTTWRSGDVVLKPAGMPAEAEWTAEVLAGMPPSPDFRVPRPVRAASGGWLADGWAAWRAVPGEPDVRRPEDVLRTGAAFHRALAGLPRPAFLDARDDPWAFGDRVAFGECPLTGREPMHDLLAALRAARRPLPLPDQPVHGDLLGNVMFDPGLPPAIIDWSVYHRPARWAEAVAVLDALTWYDAPQSLVDRWYTGPHAAQLLLHAALYRIATNEGFRRAGHPVREHAAAYRPVVRLILDRT